MSHERSEVLNGWRTLDLPIVVTTYFLKNVTESLKTVEKP